MNRLILAIIFVLYFVVGADSATIDVSPSEACDVASQDQSILMCRYTITDSVAIDNSTQEFRLALPIGHGSIRTVAIEQDSTDLGFWLAESTGQDNSSVQTLIVLDGVSGDYIYKPQTPVYFANKDTAVQRSLYLVYNNFSATNTGTSYVVLTLGRN